MNNFLRPLRADVFQVHINDTVAAIVRQTGAFTIEVWTLRDAPHLLVTLSDADPVNVAHRIAEGEFDDDFRFDISDAPDEDGNYWLEQIATPSQTSLYSSLMHDPYGFVAAERQCQAERRAFPELEDRLDHYAEMGL